MSSNRGEPNRVNEKETLRATGSDGAAAKAGQRDGAAQYAVIKR